MATALFSVFDKTGLVELAQGLHKLGWNFLASGGTAHSLRDSGLPVEDVADYTGSPEILGGRVKTLHPAVSGGILARTTGKDAIDLTKINARYIDFVVCNLYPFQLTISKTNTTLEDAIENIDIGGVTLIRAAAKNFARVVVLTDPTDYSTVFSELKDNGVIVLETRRKLANKAFAHTAAYDSAISAYLNFMDIEVTSNVNE